MTDRELLELAAKAIGRPELMAGAEYGLEGMEWNPLTDDGDALRLAVRLQIEIGFSPDERVWCSLAGEPALKEALTADLLAATRRAIVRAAAEIGRAMP